MWSNATNLLLINKGHYKTNSGSIKITRCPIPILTVGHVNSGKKVQLFSQPH